MNMLSPPTSLARVKALLVSACLHLSLNCLLMHVGPEILGMSGSLSVCVNAS